MSDDSPRMVLLRHPPKITAWRVTDANLTAVAEWCGGRVVAGGVVGPGQGELGEWMAEVGDVVVRGTTGGFWSLGPDGFDGTYTWRDER